MYIWSCCSCVLIKICFLQLWQFFCFWSQLFWCVASLLSCQPSSAALLPAVISVVAAVPYISLLLLPPRVPLTNWSWCLTGVFAVVQMFALSLSICDKQTWLWMSLCRRADSFSQVALVTRECESRRSVQELPVEWLYYTNIIQDKTGQTEGRRMKRRTEGGSRWRAERDRQSNWQQKDKLSQDNWDFPASSLILFCARGPWDLTPTPLPNATTN